MKWVGLTLYAKGGKGGGVHGVGTKFASPSIDKKNPLSDFENIQWSEGRVKLNFFNSNGAFFADLNTTFAA